MQWYIQILDIFKIKREVLAFNQGVPQKTGYFL